MRFLMGHENMPRLGHKKVPRSSAPGRAHFCASTGAQKYAPGAQTGAPTGAQKGAPGAENVPRPGHKQVPRGH